MICFESICNNRLSSASFLQRHFTHLQRHFTQEITSQVMILYGYFFRWIGDWVERLLTYFCIHLCFYLSIFFFFWGGWVDGGGVVVVCVCVCVGGGGGGGGHLFPIGLYDKFRFFVCREQHLCLLRVKFYQRFLLFSTPFRSPKIAVANSTGILFQTLV